MHQSEHETQNQQNEIDLFDLLRILWQRRVLILGGTFLATLAAAIICMLLPRVYEVSTIIEPGRKKTGKEAEEINIVSPEVIRESILGEAYNSRIATKLNMPPGEFPKFKVVVPKGTSLVKIALEESNTDQAVDIVMELNNIIQKEISDRVEYEVKEIDNNIKSTNLSNNKYDELVGLTKAQMAETAKKIKSFEASKAKAMLGSNDGTMQVLLYSNEIQEQQVYLNSLEEKLKGYEEASKGGEIRIDSLNLQKSRLKGMNIIKPVTVSDKPIKPKKLSIVVVTFITSLTGTIIYSLIMDIFARNRR